MDDDLVRLNKAVMIMLTIVEDVAIELDKEHLKLEKLKQLSSRIQGAITTFRKNAWPEKAIP